MTEFGFIDKICARFAELPLNGFEGIGDDCAVLPVADGDALLFTADLLNEAIFVNCIAENKHLMKRI